MAAHSDRNRTARRDGSVQKAKATKAARRRSAAQARAVAFACKQAGQSLILRRNRGHPIRAPPAPGRGRARGHAPAHGHPGRVPPTPPAPVGHPPSRGGVGHGGAPYAPAGRGPWWGWGVYE